MYFNINNNINTKNTFILLKGEVKLCPCGVVEMDSGVRTHTTTRGSQISTKASLQAFYDSAILQCSRN